MKKVLLSFLLALFAIPFAVQAQQIKHYTVVVDSISECGPYTWNLGNGETYAHDTVVTFIKGDTVRLLTLTINRTYEMAPVSVEAVCSYEWNGNRYNEAGTYRDTLTTVDGCDSIVSITITSVSHTIYDTINQVACGSFTWNDSLYTESTMAQRTNASADSTCDTVVTLNLTIQNALVVDTVVACGMYEWRDSAYFAATRDTMVVSANGCDSVFVLDLTFAPVQVLDTMEICGKYEWLDSVYLVSGDYTKNIVGRELTYDTLTWHCDSIYKLHLSVIANTDTVVDSACYQYVWNHGYDKDTLLASTVRDVVFQDTVSKCVTNYHLDLTIKALSMEGHEAFDTVSKCSTIQYRPFNERSLQFNASTSMDTTFVKAYRTMSQCYDSTLHAHLIVRNPTNYVDKDTTVCDSYTWPANEVEYTTSGTYTYKVGNNEEGCDSIAKLILVVNASPVISSILGETTVTPGASTTLSADVNQNVTYKWSYGNQTATTAEITINNITENTDVTLVVKNNKQCTDTGWVTIMPYVFIEDAQAANISLYPNPTVAIVNIDCAEAISNVAVFNTVGQQVMNESELGSKAVLDFSTLSKGNYTLRVVLASGEVIVRKVVVTR